MKFVGTMKDFWSPLQEIIETTCEEFNREWQTRKRVIDTKFLVLFIMKLVLSKNNQGYKILLNELWESSEISAFQEQPVSASSLCEARLKMPARIFELINEKLIAARGQEKTRQECYAHIVLANLARIFEQEADENLPPPTSSSKDSSNITNCQSNSYWQDFCGKIKEFKVNFKNCLLIVNRRLSTLLIGHKQINITWLTSLLKSIARLRQKIRPGRHYARQSRKPINKWKCSRGEKVSYA